MAWLQTLDVALFRFINQTLSHPALDVVMPFFSGNRLFVPAVILVAVALLWKGGARGRIFVATMIALLMLGDMLVIGMLKTAVGRPRPFVTLDDARLLVGEGGSGSMPSSHTATWFAATLLAFVFYRRSWRFMLPLAVLVGLSRVYVGVHYPGDVLAGAALGAGYAAAGLWTLNALWQRAGREWFPEWWRTLPSLLDPLSRPGREAASGASSAMRDRQWLHLGWVFIGVLLAVHLGYLAGGVIELSKDEAYQWVWSKHLALSYYSKPPGIALIQFAGTSLWGDTEFGVRFFSPVFAAVLSLVLLRFMAREVNARAAFLLVLIVNLAPLMAVGTVLMTIDPPLVLCWTLAMVAGWRAAQPDGATRHWLFAGVALGLGFLSKYSAAMQVICWGIFFALHPPARAHLKRPGPWLALLVLALSTIPVIVWNSQNDWITVRHVSQNAALDQQWKPTLRFFWDFLFVEAALLNPVFFIGALWAMAAFWKRRREQPLWLFFFCMGAPVFLGYWAYSFHSRILPNWIAPAVLPMFCLMVAYWDARWRAGAHAVKRWLTAGLAFGAVTATLMHESNWIGKIAGRALPPERDPLRRVRAWKETAAAVEAARQRLLAEGRPAFIISHHYGMAGLFTFYLPAAKAAVRATPLVYSQSTATPENQFYFWPGYRGRRTGENAIYVVELDLYHLADGWVWPWLSGAEVSYAAPPAPPPPVPESLRAEFASVTDLGVREIHYRGRLFRRVQLYECRNLR